MMYAGATIVQRVFLLSVWDEMGLAGNTIWNLFECESGVARIAEVVATCRAALQECTRDQVPLRRTLTQRDLGLALMTLGVHDGGTAPLEEAVVAFRSVL